MSAAHLNRSEHNILMKLLKAGDALPSNKKLLAKLICVPFAEFSRAWKALAWYFRPLGNKHLAIDTARITEAGLDESPKSGKAFKDPVCSVYPPYNGRYVSDQTNALDTAIPARGSPEDIARSAFAHRLTETERALR